MQHDQSGRRSLPAGISLWMIGGGVVGLIEAVVAYDPKLSFHPISDWITRLVLVPCLYALGAAVIWLALGGLLGLRRRSADGGSRPGARLALAALGTVLVFAHLAELLNQRLAAGVVSGSGLAASAACLAAAAVCGGLLYLLAASQGWRAPLGGAVAALDRIAPRRLLVAALVGTVVGGAFYLYAARPELAARFDRSGGRGRNPAIARVLVIGLDAADWKVLWPMMRRGELPNLERLARTGRADDMHTFGRPNSAMVWTSIVTGVSEAKHGIHDFTLKLPGSYRTVSSQSFHRRVRAIWDIVGDMGLGATVIDFPITFPPEAINGLMVTRLHSTAGPVTEPPGALAGLDASCLEPPPATADIRDFAAHARDLDERLERVRRLAVCLEERQPAELFMVYTHTTDAVQHLFWKFAFPEQFSEQAWNLAALRGSGLENVLADHWRATDRMVGDIVAQADESTLVLVISDHGAQARPLPYASLEVGELLATMGWSPAEPAAADGQSDLEATLAYDADLSRYCDYAGISLNLAGREPAGVIAAAAFDDEVAALVAALRAVRFSDGTPLFSEVHDYRRVEERFRDRFGAGAMDVIAMLSPVFRGPRAAQLGLSLPRRDGELELRPVTDFRYIDQTSGGHRPHGVLIANGPGIARALPPQGFPATWTRRFGGELARIAHLAGGGEPLCEPNTLDLTPTLLYALGLPVARDMEGRALLELFDARYQRAHPLRWIDTYETGSGAPDVAREHDIEVDEEQLEYLRALGYIN